jgi:hypothetical protein
MMKQGFINYEKSGGRSVKISFFQLDNILAMQSKNPKYLQERFAKKQTFLCINALEVAKKIDTTTATVRALIKIGLLKTTVTYIQGEPVPVVTEYDLVMFQITYVIRKSLAKLLKTTPCYLDRTLKRFNLRPINGPEIDRFRISIYKMADVLDAMSRPVSNDVSFL